jgi:asparagine synthase (glutamine-hydrolysing)
MPMRRGSALAPYDADRRARRLGSAGAGDRLMCGILLAVGDAFRADFDAALATLAHARARRPRSAGPRRRAARPRAPGGDRHRRRAPADDSADGRLAMVYNGEIYNFAALAPRTRSRRACLRHALGQRSLLTGYRHWGEAVLDKLDGMFAFAIHDLADGSVFLARDRVGIKPCSGANMRAAWWRVDPGALLRAAGLSPKSWMPKACATTSPSRRRWRRIPWCATSMPCRPAPACAGNRRRVRDSLRQNATPVVDHPDASEAAPDPDSAGRGNRRAAGHGRSRTSWWPTCRSAPSFPAASTAASSCITWRRPAPRRLRTFSVRFAEAGFDESPAARAVAEKYGTEHHVLDAPQLDAETLAAALADLDQPLADPAYIPPGPCRA